KSLQYATFEKQLLRIDYQSPEKGAEGFSFLGESLTYKDGALYIKGYQPHREDLVLLRVDRIESLQVIEDEMLRASLLQKALQNEGQILILYPGLSQEEYEPYGLHEQIESFQQYPPSQGHLEPSLLAIFQQKDKFYLKQKLLGEDKPFKIMGPESFKNEMKETLLGMQALYQKET
ncbi:MAG: WYL domain-containing protein, partial [Cyanobacteria bacterium]|nr:WYL domain-containing protein [Cyanobacteriota bacterium]